MQNLSYDTLEKYLDGNRKYLFDMLSELIRINTENDRSTAHESRIARFMRAELQKLGIECDLYRPDSVNGILTHEDYRMGKDFSGRENFTAKIPGKSGKRALMLAGHSDTMPVGDLSLWSVPPLEGLMMDGKIWGRGACDDKYALASMLFMAKAIKELDIELASDVYLTAYVDEEFGGGNGALAAALKYPCDFYVNLDCKNLDIWRCAAGGQRIILQLSHSEFQHSCHLMMEALHIVKEEIDVFGNRRIAELKKNVNFENSIIPDTAIRYMNMATGLNTNDRHKGVFDFAFYTDKTRAEIWDELEETFGKINLRLEPLGIRIENVIESSRFFGYGFVENDNAEINLLKKVGKSILNREIYDKASCLSDLSLFLSAAPGRAISFGAGRDFDVRGGAHLPDEFIECDDLLNFTKIITKFTLEWDKGDF